MMYAPNEKMSFMNSIGFLCRDAFFILLLATVISSLPIMLLIMCEQNTWRKIQNMKEWVFVDCSIMTSITSFIYSYYRSIDTGSERAPLISRLPINCEKSVLKPASLLEQSILIWNTIQVMHGMMTGHQGAPLPMCHLQM